MPDQPLILDTVDRPDADLRAVPRLTLIDVDMILAQCAGRVPRDLTPRERAEFNARTLQDAVKRARAMIDDLVGIGTVTARMDEEALRTLIEHADVRRSAPVVL